MRIRFTTLNPNWTARAHRLNQALSRSAQGQTRAFIRRRVDTDSLWGTQHTHQVIRSGLMVENRLICQCLSMPGVRQIGRMGLQQLPRQLPYVIEA